VENQVSRSLSRDLKPDTKQVSGRKQSPQRFMCVIISLYSSLFYFVAVPLLSVDFLSDTLAYDSCFPLEINVGLLKTLAERNCIKLSVHVHRTVLSLSLYGSISLGPWPLFQFINPVHSW
jgi:hypothetical protein